MKTKNILNLYIYFIIFLKIIFILLALADFIIKHFYNTNVNLMSIESKISFYKKRIEFIFIICMVILIIFIFSPRHNRMIYLTKEMTILFYLFGFILLLTADWDLFLTNAKWYNNIKNLVK